MKVSLEIDYALLYQWCMEPFTGYFIKQVLIKGNNEKQPDQQALYQKIGRPLFLNAADI